MSAAYSVPAFARAQGTWLQMKICVLAIYMALVSPAIYLWQRETLLLVTAGYYLCTFWALVL